MRWAPRQLLLPVLIGISLTGVSLGIIYLLSEKDKQRDKAARGERLHASLTLEFAVPREFVPAIIGRGGSMIHSIENATDTRIRFIDDDPDLPHRLCTIKGTSESLRMAEAMIKTMIASQPLIETYEYYIPQRVCPKIIGRCGETINQIQSSSKAKIILEKSWTQEPHAKRRVIIKGTAEQIANALSQIEDKVHEYTETLEKLVASESSRSPRSKVVPRILAVNPSSDIPLLTASADDQTLHEGTMEVYVSAVENPSQFWVQVAGAGTLSLDNLVADMTTYYENAENRELHALKDITVGQTVAAKFLFDGKWYRAEITTVKNNECEVYFVDYGDHEIVFIEHVFELRTDFLSLRLQAIECALANVTPRDGEWSTEASDRFCELTWVAQWKVLIAKVRGYKERTLGCGSSRREGSPIPCVDLYDKNDNQDINIGKVLVAENLVEAKEGAWSASSSTASLFRNSIENTRSPTPVRSPPPPPPPSGVNDKTSETLSTKKNSNIEEIDLTTPRKSVGPVEEIDLVTPVKITSQQFIKTEISKNLGNGSGDAEDYHRYYGNGTRPVESRKPKYTNVMPAGYDSDNSNESEDFEGFSLG